MGKIVLLKNYNYLACLPLTMQSSTSAATDKFLCWLFGKKQINKKVKLSICKMQRLCGMVDQQENVTSELPLDHYGILKIKFQMHMISGRESLFETVHLKILPLNASGLCLCLWCKGPVLGPIGKVMVGGPMLNCI